MDDIMQNRVNYEGELIRVSQEIMQGFDQKKEYKIRIGHSGILDLIINELKLNLNNEGVILKMFCDKRFVHSLEVLRNNDFC